MNRITACTRGVLLASALLSPAFLAPGFVLAMGDANHDLARDMATGVYGVPYDGPNVPEAPSAAERAPERADAEADPRTGCGSSGGTPPDCRKEAPRRRSQ